MTGSLRIQIGLLYVVLAVSSIVFSAMMIFENQTDLLLDTFVLRSEKQLRELQTELARANEKGGDLWTRRHAVLAGRHITSYVAFDEDGRIVRLAGRPRGPDLKPGGTVPNAWRLRSLEIGRQGSAFTSRNHMELDRADFSARVIFPLADGRRRLYLKTTFVLPEVKRRLRDLYVQIAWAVVWGLGLYTVFAFFVVRLFLRRVDLLTLASEHMSAGDLSARAGWELKRGDEIDRLGHAFNHMAERVEETVSTISRLNDEIQNELEIGQEVQERFLPSRDVIPEYAPAIYYRPMREVSGDIYSFRRMPNGQALVLLADATGHGVPAALITAVAMMGLDTILTREQDLARIGDGLNEVLTERVSQQFYMTGALFAIDENQLTYMNAGHPPPLLLRADGSMEELIGDDPPLGLLEEHRFGVHKIDARKGDRLLVYSDGLIEMESAGGQPFGLERVKERLAALCKIHAENEVVLNHLVQEFEEHIDVYSDDLTLLLLKF